MKIDYKNLLETTKLQGKYMEGFLAYALALSKLPVQVHRKLEIDPDELLFNSVALPFAKGAAAWVGQQIAMDPDTFSQGVTIEKVRAASQDYLLKNFRASGLSQQELQANQVMVRSDDTTGQLKMKGKHNVDSSLQKAFIRMAMLQRENAEMTEQYINDSVLSLAFPKAKDGNVREHIEAAALKGLDEILMVISTIAEGHIQLANEICDTPTLKGTPGHKLHVQIMDRTSEMLELASLHMMVENLTPEQYAGGQKPTIKELRELFEIKLILKDYLDGVYESASQRLNIPNRIGQVER